MQEWLNYQHLQYFWVTAREGSVRAASTELRLAPSTVSAQLKLLAAQLGQDLFQRVGRGLVLTPFGHEVFHYADAIFMTGRELLDLAGGRRTGRPLRLEVGVAGVVPKLLARRFIEPAFDVEEGELHLVVREDRQALLLAELALHHLDVVITDAPVGPESHLRVFTHALGGTDVAFFAKEALALELREGFPQSLNGAPCLLPSSETALRRLLDHWFDARDLHPIVVSEFDDSALLKAFGQRGHGFFAGPAVIADEIKRQYEVVEIGLADGVREEFFAVSLDRVLRHPGVARIKASANALLDHGPPQSGS
ncbi:MAG: LysR family transcriptional activator of nhaA [Myxococcota bacterium]|jgi:LysR family transcriptional activator of nhaA